MDNLSANYRNGAGVSIYHRSSVSVDVLDVENRFSMSTL